MSENSGPGAPTLWILAASAALAGCATGPERSIAEPVSEVGYRAAQPHAAVGADGRIVVVWGLVSPLGMADVVFATVDRDGRLRAPRRVHSTAGTAVAGRQVGPRVRVLGSGRILVSWIDRGRDVAGDVVLAFSDDGGESFSLPVRVNDDPGMAGQEYHDLAVLPDGDVRVVWLDERDAPAASPNQKQLYSAHSRDGGRTFEPNRKVTDSTSGVCPCCRPSLAVQPNGIAHVVYRDREREELVVRLRRASPGDPFGDPVDVPGARWRYMSCPVDGPTLAVADDGDLLVAWMDGATLRERLWVVRSDDGTSFEPRRELTVPSDESAARRASLAFGRTLGALAAWEDTHGRVWVKRLEEGGANTPVLLGGGGVEREASSVVLVGGGGEVHAFWVEENLAALLSGGVTAPEASRLRHARVVGRGQTVRILHDDQAALLANDRTEAGRNAD